MARITIEDCLEQVENRFAIVLMAARRVRQLNKGAKPLVESKNKIIVTALREIAAGKVKIKQDKINKNGGNKPASDSRYHNRSEFMTASTTGQI